MLFYVCARTTLLIMCARMYVLAGWLVDIYLCVCCSSNLQSLLKFIRLAIANFSFAIRNRIEDFQINSIDCQKKKLEAAAQQYVDDEMELFEQHREGQRTMCMYVCVSVKYNFFAPPDFTWNTANRRWFLWPFGTLNTKHTVYFDEKKFFSLNCCGWWCFWCCCWCCLTNFVYIANIHVRSFAGSFAGSHAHTHTYTKV